MKENKHNYAVWLKSDDYKKLKFQTDSAIMEILLPLEKYGQQPYVWSAREEIMEIIEKSWKRIRRKMGKELGELHTRPQRQVRLYD